MGDIQNGRRSVMNGTTIFKKSDFPSLLTLENIPIV